MGSQKEPDATQQLKDSNNILSVGYLLRSTIAGLYNNSVYEEQPNILLQWLHHFIELAKKLASPMHSCQQCVGSYVSLSLPTFATVHFYCNHPHGCTVVSCGFNFHLANGEGNGNPLQYSCLDNPMDREAWWATVHGVAKNQTRLKDFTYLMTNNVELLFTCLLVICISSLDKVIEIFCISKNQVVFVVELQFFVYSGYLNTYQKYNVQIFSLIVVNCLRFPDHIL